MTSFSKKIRRALLLRLEHLDLPRRIPLPSPSSLQQHPSRTEASVSPHSPHQPTLCVAVCLRIFLFFLLETEHLSRHHCLRTFFIFSVDSTKSHHHLRQCCKFWLTILSHFTVKLIALLWHKCASLNHEFTPFFSLCFIPASDLLLLCVSVSQQVKLLHQVNTPLPVRSQRFFRLFGVRARSPQGFLLRFFEPSRKIDEYSSRYHNWLLSSTELTRLDNRQLRQLCKVT